MVLIFFHLLILKILRWKKYQMKTSDLKTIAENLIEIFKKNATEDSISSTPSFVINGQLVQNMSYEELKNIIDDNLEK